MYKENLCPNCFNEDFINKCKNCGYVAIQQSANYLPTGIVLNKNFIVGRVLGCGGFGITYLAKDIKNNNFCALKEYLPNTIAIRDLYSKYVLPRNNDNLDVFTNGIKLFLNEAVILNSFLGNQNIVQVMDSFEENGTAYFTMEYLEGVNLSTLLKSMGGKLPYLLSFKILQNIALTLKSVHEKGLLHRDVSPENIFATKNGSIKLIDFGATRYFIGDKSKSLSVILKPGYAPLEQYYSKGKQGAWTDVYALCSTFYTLVTGNKILDAPSRLQLSNPYDLNGILSEINTEISTIIEKGLMLKHESRIQNMSELLDALSFINANSIEINNVDVKGVPYIQFFKNGVPSDKWIIPKNIIMYIGRTIEKCNIIIDSNEISRVHCNIRYDENKRRFYLIDLSSNGTYLADGTRIKKNTVYSLLPENIFYLLSEKYIMKVGVE